MAAHPANTIPAQCQAHFKVLFARRRRLPRQLLKLLPGAQQEALAQQLLACSKGVAGSRRLRQQHDANHTSSRCEPALLQNPCRHLARLTPTAATCQPAADNQQQKHAPPCL